MPEPGTKYYFITYFIAHALETIENNPRILNTVIDKHPLDWLCMGNYRLYTLLFWDEISEEQYEHYEGFK